LKIQDKGNACLYLPDITRSNNPVPGREARGAERDGIAEERLCQNGSA
jgi:hypothetical protein